VEDELDRCESGERDRHIFCRGPNLRPIVTHLLGHIVKNILNLTSNEGAKFFNCTCKNKLFSALEVDEDLNIH